MQFVSEILNFQCLLVLAAIFVSASNALLCTTCLDRTSCTNTPETQVCTVDLVTLHHGLLKDVNPNLVVPPSNASVFKCYDLDMSYESPLTGSRVMVVHKGCTYNSTNFCEGWVNTTAVNRCTTCDSGDDCNKGQTEGTTTSVAPTTPLNNSTTTVASTTVVSTTDVSNTTTSASLTTTTEATTTTSAPANSTTTSASVTATTTTAATTTPSAPANSTTTSASVTSTTTTAATTTPSAPAHSTTTSATTTVTTARPSTSTVTATTAKAGGVTNLGCFKNWFTIAGYALLHGLITRW